ncbi:MAG TPA: hypothetical protein VG125_19695 [Pirellulales bacterium]|jgi:hypothetical protein|nr:hypothetical protein [Pirellulales bacterium]
MNWCPVLSEKDGEISAKHPHGRRRRNSNRKVNAKRRSKARRAAAVTTRYRSQLEPQRRARLAKVRQQRSDRRDIIAENRAAKARAEQERIDAKLPKPEKPPKPRPWRELTAHERMSLQRFVRRPI